MPSTSTTSNAPSPNKSDAIKSTEQRVEAAADQATRAAADKAKQVGEQLHAAASSVQSRTGELVQGALNTASKLGPELAEGARQLSHDAKQAADHALQEGSALVHQARDAALDGYQSARDQAAETVHDLTDRVQRAGQQTASYLQRASTATGRFATVHALPLTFVGAGLGWLAFSILREARRPTGFDAEHTHTTRARLAAPMDRRPVAPARDARPRSSGATTTGQRLMGVRVRDAGYEDDLWTP